MRADTVLVAAAVIERAGKILAARRKRGSHLEGHWEFPGGKLEPGESPEECLVRELREECGVEVRPGRILEVVFHRYGARDHRGRAPTAPPVQGLRRRTRSCSSISPTRSGPGESSGTRRSSRPVPSASGPSS